MLKHNLPICRKANGVPFFNRPTSRILGGDLLEYGMSQSAYATLNLS